MSAYRTVQDLVKAHDVQGRCVLLRADLNVPLKQGRMCHESRLAQHKESLMTLRAAGAKVAVLSHFGRPGGCKVPEMSLAPMASALSAHAGVQVGFATDCIGPSAQDCLSQAKGGDVVVLENTRFHPGEEKNDPQFAQALAALGDFYVNDAFSVAHRAHASTEGLAHLRPAFAGCAMSRELETLTHVLETPPRPALALVGGAKISTKIGILAHLVEKMDTVFVGGAMAHVFLEGCGDDLRGEQAKTILTRARAAGCEIVLPEDVMVVSQLGSPAALVGVRAIPEGMKSVDIGVATVERVKRLVEASATVLWNGPLGIFEVSPFEKGTEEVARHVAQRTGAGQLLSVAGGGSTEAALHQVGVAESFSYVSRAGGAFLEWVEGRTLPGVAALHNGRMR